ncbi:MAG: hypothetical protein JKY01_08130, partial [Pseudomonadales bacterium]|nr:hypothetical protein [Pseudomonadales bacterium]
EIAYYFIAADWKWLHELHTNLRRASFWKHVVNRLPLKYEPIWWSLVFPLGMYSVASGRLGLAAEFPPLQWISELMIWVAVCAWFVVLFGLIKQLWRTVKGEPRNLETLP